MNQLHQFLSSDASHILGWTLLHSLWQAFLIVLIVRLFLRFYPHISSSVRYIVALGGLLAICISCIITACIINQKISQPVISNIEYNTIGVLTHENRMVEKDHSFVSNTMVQWLQSKIPVIVGMWVAGAILFSLRIMGAWVYINIIRKKATLLYDHWTDRLIVLAHHLRIEQPVMLATSTAITIPMVIGYMRPLIIVPSIMFTGLTPAQIETILLHELAHIRRHDYIINLIQSFVEALFFFNPFTWLLSSTIRTEREYCCDDAVLASNVNALDYANALRQLEEVRISTPGLAMSLISEKYTLLTRIKRIMEKSVTSYPKWERLIPVFLLIIGFASAALASVNRSDDKTISSSKEIVYTYPDTIKPREHSKIRKDDPLHDEAVEVETIINFKNEVQEPPFPTPSYREVVDIVMPPIQSISGHTVILPLRFELSWDTIPEKMIQLENFELEKWNKTFEESFNLDFSDLHINEINKIAHRLNEELFHLNQSFKNIAHIDTEMIEKQLYQQMKQQELLEIQFQHHAMTEERMKQMEQLYADQLLEEEARLKLWQENNKRALSKLETHLIKDGYLKKDQKIKSIHWSSNGTLKVNGILIKESDAARYKKLYGTYPEFNLRMSVTE